MADWYADAILDVKSEIMNLISTETIYRGLEQYSISFAEDAEISI